MTEGRWSLIVPAFGRTLAPEPLSIARALLAADGGHGAVVGVVEVPESRSVSESAVAVRRRRSKLRNLAHGGGQVDVQVDVRTAHSQEEGIREAVLEGTANLLLLAWKDTGRTPRAGAMEKLVSDPPCDLAVVKSGNATEIRKILVPARGGPQALLALRVAEAIARAHVAILTLFHIDLSTRTKKQRASEEAFFEELLKQASYGQLEQVRVTDTSIEGALVSEGSRHDLVVMGAAARDERSSYLLGRIPETVSQTLDVSSIIVKTRVPVTARTFGLPTQSRVPAAHRDISQVVDRWFAENTFHSHEFRNLRYLVDLKAKQNLTISLVLPTLNEEKTVGKIVSTIKRQLQERVPLVDELLVIDSDSRDRTVEIVEAQGVSVFQHAGILPGHGTHRGKGEALWKSLQVTRGDIVVWVDSDITGFHPKFVYGLLGPLLTQSRLGFVKGFYRRPLNLGGQLLTTGGGRVTELTARPLLNLFYPQLSGLVQPLAGEMAGRRNVLESIPFFTGYGVETGLLIDILERHGLDAIGQTDLEERVHRNQSLLSLSEMAFAIVQVVVKRLGGRERLTLMQEISNSMKLIHYSPTELFLEVKEIQEEERPPITSLQEYQAHRSEPGILPS